MTHSVAYVLEINNLRMRYPSSPNWILEDLNLNISYGQCMALVGPSGCGKSTLAKLILGLVPSGSIDKGQILVNGRDPRYISPSQLRHLRGEEVGFVFQDPMSRLNPLMTIGQHLIDTLRAHRPGKKSIWYREKSVQLLEKLGINPERFDSYPHEFSGGMRQRVVIALAISLNPSLIIADEPTTSLDITVATQVMEELKAICHELGTSLLLITHDLAMASKFCEHMAILDEGKLVEEGLSKNIVISPKSLVAKRLISAARQREESKSSFLVSNHLPILEVNQLRCWHSRTKFPLRRKWLKTVDGVSFSVHEGESLGLVGFSGCGKSTLCRALMGLLPIQGGQIKLLGKDLGVYKKESKFRQHMQMVFQDPLSCLNPKMKVGEAIADPLLIHGICSEGKSKEKARDLLEKVGLYPPEKYQYRFPNELSGGQQQRVAIARSLALNPRILICDESLSMLDCEIQIEILNLLRVLQAKLNLAILLITHDINIATGFCNEVMVLDHGKIIEKGIGRDLINGKNQSITRKLYDASFRLPLINC